MPEVKLSSGYSWTKGFKRFGRGLLIGGGTAAAAWIAANAGAEAAGSGLDPTVAAVVTTAVVALAEWAVNFIKNINR